MLFSVANFNFVEKRERIEFAETVNKIDRRFKVGFISFHFFFEMLTIDDSSLCLFVVQNRFEFLT